MRGRNLSILVGLTILSSATIAAAEALAAKSLTATHETSNSPDAHVALDPRIQRGSYLTAVGDCLSCHTQPGAAPFSGGVGFTTPLGTIYSSNITPDDETGIGRWSTVDLRRAMHEGIAPNGHHLFPAFPYTSFTKVADDDADAIYAYLRTLKAVSYRPPDNGILFSQRWTMALWNALYFIPGRYQPDTSKSAEWNRGAYFVEGLGHCGECHSPRNLLMAEVTEKAYAGGTFQDQVVDGKVRRWAAVNLTSAKSGLSSWSVEDLSKYLKSGVCARAGTFGPMNDVISHGTLQLTPDDVRAMATYIKALPAQEPSASAISAADITKGSSTYKERCEKCHMTSGRGGIFSGPPLTGSAVVQAPDPASLINIILYGPRAPMGVAFGAWESMKPYSGVLSDAEIAAVANYVRGSWGNKGGSVTTSDVSLQR